jgi:hypothetical protein
MRYNRKSRQIILLKGIVKRDYKASLSMQEESCRLDAVGFDFEVVDSKLKSFHQRWNCYTLEKYKRQIT